MWVYSNRLLQSEREILTLLLPYAISLGYPYNNSFNSDYVQAMKNHLIAFLSE